jgi:hypothetical protein
MVEIEKLLECLLKADVEFIVVGGVAATAFGSTYVTADLDICYKRSKENISRLVQALAPLNPQLRGPQELPLDVPFHFDERTVQNGGNFTLITSLGSIDLLSELSGIGKYEDIAANYLDTIQVGPLLCQSISLAGLIRNKEASKRPKDLIHVIELKAIEKMKKDN